MSSMPPPDYMPSDPLDGSPDMLVNPSLYFDEEEPLFPPPLGGEHLLSCTEPAWPNSDEMTGNSSSAQSWQITSAEMTRNDSSATTQSLQANHAFDYATIQPVQTTALPAVEMPTQTSSSESPANSLPVNTSPRGMRRRKRKSSPLSDEEEDEAETPESPPSRPPLKKTAHNMIEKRYRTNLNDKIAALKQSVPSLRATEKSLIGKSGRKLADMMEELDGLIPPNKLNKATILAKATEYIGHLERRNQSLLSEKTALEERITAFENIVMGKQMYHPDRLMLHQHQMMDHNNMNQRHSRN